MPKRLTLQIDQPQQTPHFHFYESITLIYRAKAYETDLT